MLIEEFVSVYTRWTLFLSVSFFFFRSFNNSNLFGVAVQIVDVFPPLTTRLRFLAIFRSGTIFDGDMRVILWQESALRTCSQTMRKP